MSDRDTAIPEHMVELHFRDSVGNIIPTWVNARHIISVYDSKDEGSNVTLTNGEIKRATEKAQIVAYRMQGWS